MSSTASPHPCSRYEEVAAFIEALLDAGVLAPGARLPSLRRISAERGVSLATALQAYRLLEDRGVVTARPQSGYYVAAPQTNVLLAPGVDVPPSEPVPVTIGDVIAELLRHAADTRLVPLGCAIPSPQVLAESGIDRTLSRTARRSGVEQNIYTQPRGSERLRHEIARRSARHGHVIAVDSIAVTIGATEALSLALRTVAKAGDTIGVESPTYFGMLHSLEMLGLRALELPTSPSDGVDLAALEKTLKEGTIAACLLSSSFNNPLGCTMPEDKKIELLAILGRHGVPLIEDDVYGDVYFGNQRPRPFAALGRDADVFYCSSFSKVIAPGYRMGWIAAPKARMRSILELKSASTLCNPAILQATFAEFLAAGSYERHMVRMRRLFADNLACMRRAIGSAFPAGTKASKPNGGFVVWLELPGRIDTRVLFERALAKGICFAPGDVFSASRRFSNCLRLSAGHVWDHRLERAVWTLGEMAAAMC